MHYVVKARLIASGAAELHRKLTDGSIKAQKPDGNEIVASMQRARVTRSGLIQWSAVCYCDTPLAHERETVYDHHFTDIETEEVDDYVEFEGEPLMDHLAG